MASAQLSAGLISRLQSSTILTPQVGPDWMMQVDNTKTLTQQLMNDDTGPHVVYCPQRGTEAGNAYIDGIAHWRSFGAQSDYLARMEKLGKAHPLLGGRVRASTKTSEVDLAISGWQNKSRKNSAAEQFGIVLKHFLPPAPARDLVVSDLVNDWRDATKVSGADRIRFILRASAPGTDPNELLHIDPEDHVIINNLTRHDATMHAKPTSWHEDDLSWQGNMRYLDVKTRDVRAQMGMPPARTTTGHRGGSCNLLTAHAAQPTGNHTKIICMGMF